MYLVCNKIKYKIQRLISIPKIIVPNVYVSKCKRMYKHVCIQRHVCLAFTSTRYTAYMYPIHVYLSLPE